MKKFLVVLLVLISIIFASCESTNEVNEKVENTIEAYKTETASMDDLIKQVETRAVKTYIANQLLLTPTITPTAAATSTPTANPFPPISARQGWQSTGFNALSGQSLIISVVGGEWTSQEGVVPLNKGVGGSPYICADYISASRCVEPLPTAQAGILICRIGNEIYEIGEENTIIAAADGEVSCRINDGDDGLYDNNGSLFISIVTQ